MLRPALTLASALSLLLCVAASALWVRSYRCSDQLAWVNDDGQRLFRTAQGHAVFSMNLADGFKPGVDQRGVRYSRDVTREIGVELIWPLFLCSDAAARWTQHRWGGFAWLERRTNRGLLATATVPFWSITTATALPPTVWALALLAAPRARARRRLRRGLCPRCGYDVCATPERCPECGIVIGAAAARVAPSVEWSRPVQ